MDATGRLLVAVLAIGVGIFGFGPGAAPASASEGMVVFVDPETGALRARPGEVGAAIDFPELRGDPSRVREEVRADGTVLTWLNGNGVEAQVLLDDGQGGQRAACTGALETGAVRRQDLRGAVAAREVRDVR